MRRRFSLMVWGVFQVFVCASVSSGSDVQVAGVFGLDNICSETALAVWVPLDDDDSVAGIRWFNNDEFTEFPSVEAIAGDPGQPELLPLAYEVGIDVQGQTSAWSEFVFDQPIGSESSGVYIIFRIPAGGEFLHSGVGGGAGFGYLGEGVGRECWITGDGESWDRIHSEFPIAIEATINLSKSDDCIVLKRLAGAESREAESRDAEGVSELRLVASPNPFNPQTRIEFTLPEQEVVDLDVFDIRGRLVRKLCSRSFGAGLHSVVWDGRDNSNHAMASGVYFSRLTLGEQTRVLRLVLVR